MVGVKRTPKSVQSVDMLPSAMANAVDGVGEMERGLMRMRNEEGWSGGITKNCTATGNGRVHVLRHCPTSLSRASRPRPFSAQAIRRRDKTLSRDVLCPGGVEDGIMDKARMGRGRMRRETGPRTAGTVEVGYRDAPGAFEGVRVEEGL